MGQPRQGLLKCDACGRVVRHDRYCTDESVCGGTDGPGFFVCRSKACVRSLSDLTVDQRRLVYTVGRAAHA